MDPFRNALEQELARLQEELRNDPRALRAQKITELLALYSLEGEATPARARHGLIPIPVPTYDFSLPDPASEVVAGAPPPPDGQDRKTKASRMKAEVRHLLAANGRMHRTKILEHLQDAGIMTREGNPMANLAAYLSDWRDEFASDGKGNFSLRPSVTPEPPPAPESGAGSAEGRNPGSDPGLPFNRH